MSGAGQIADSVRIEKGKIAALNEPPRQKDCVLDADGSFIFPGLINAHDHLAMNNFGKIKYRDIYPSADEWSRDIEARLHTDPAITLPRAVPIADRLFIGGIKNLFAGVTTVCHHDPWHRSLEKNFPVKVVQKFGYCHSLQRGGDVAKTFRHTPRGAPWIIHLAEGTDEASARELDTLDELSCLKSNSVVVHGVGLTQEQRRKMIERGAALVWCPSSNFFLLGQTARVDEFARARLLALGSDSRLTGPRDLLDELSCAVGTGQIAAEDLLRLITDDAAKILHLKNYGRIDIGAPADFVILPSRQTLGRARRADVRAVLIDGQVRVADPDFHSLIPNAVCGRIDGVKKIFARDLAERYKRNSIREDGLEM